MPSPVLCQPLAEIGAVVVRQAIRHASEEWLRIVSLTKKTIDKSGKCFFPELGWPSGEFNSDGRKRRQAGLYRQDRQGSY